MPVLGLRHVCVRVRAEHGLFPAGPYGLAYVSRLSGAEPTGCSAYPKNRGQ